jgi:hypothetical protein
VCLFAAIWSAAHSGFVGGAGSDGGGGSSVTVTLVGPLGRNGELESPEQAARSSLANHMDALMRNSQLVAPDPAPRPQPTRTSGNLDQLMDAISQSRRSQSDRADTSQKGDNRGQGDNGEATSASQAKGEGPAKARQGKSNDQGEQGHARDDLWGQLQTCWRPNSPVAVTLEIVVDSSGGLAVPPKILRPLGARLDEVRYRAEADAVDAVARCAPFRSGIPIIGRKTYQFAFAPKKAN